jgi:hypothetical protein
MLDDFENRLIEGDCLDVLPELPTDSVDLVLCDLPYGTTRNGWDSLIPLGGLWNEYLRVAKERAAIVLTAQGLFTARLIMSRPEHFKYKIVWEKSKATNFLNAKRQPLRKHEDICVFYQKAPTYNPQMSEGDAYDKGVRKDQLTGSYGDFDPAHVKSEGGATRRISSTSRQPRASLARCGTPRRSPSHWGATWCVRLPIPATWCSTTPSEAGAFWSRR